MSFGWKKMLLFVVAVCFVISVVQLSTVAIQDAWGHVYSEEWTVDKKESCTEEGEMSQYCLYCNGRRNITTIVATGHQLEPFELRLAPNCEQDGLEESICGYCGGVVTRALEALGHNWRVVETILPGCETSGDVLSICTRCNQSEYHKIGRAHV